MDESNRRPIESKKHRKLIRTPEVSACDIPSAVVTIATTVTEVMGGGITTPHSSLLDGSNQEYCPLPGVGTAANTSKQTTTNTHKTLYNTLSSGSGNIVNVINNRTSISSGSDHNKKPPACPRTIPPQSAGICTIVNNVTTESGSTNSSDGNNDSATLAKIHNFLFKSSDTTKSIQSKNNIIPEQQQQQQPPPTATFITPTEKQKYGQEYYYPLTSPNNPFLPEIITKAYCIDQSNDDPSIKEDESATDIMAAAGSGGRILSSPASMTGKHPCSASPYHQENQILGNNNRKKLFTLSSPPSSEPSNNEQKLQAQQLPSSGTLISPQHNTSAGSVSSGTISSGIIAGGTGGGRSLNPFLNSPISGTTSQQNDLIAKREEFLRATMKICLVVSPPSSKLQLKSKSLTHLDTLDSLVACQQGNATSPQKPKSEQLDTTGQPQKQSTSQSQQSKTCNKICCLGSTTTPTATTSISPTNLAQLGSPQGAAQKKKSSFMQRKKPLLTRSEVSSSEYFSVYFHTEMGCKEEELIPATKGITLSEALNSALKRRNLTFSQITISDNNFQNFSEMGSPPYTNSLDENTDIENLAGKILIISEKEGSKKTGTLQKAASFGSRTRPPRLLSSASTEETTELEQKIIPGKQLKQRWSGLFGIKNPQQSQLCELLNSYAKSGVPQKSSSVNFDHPDFDQALEYLDKMHKSWRDFVNCTGMTDTDVRIQSAIWELVTTEVDYIHALQTVTDLFLACLEAIQEEKLLTDVDQNKLFSNIRDICEANLKFWTHYLYPMVAHSITTHNPMCVDFFQPGFLTFATTFAPYKKYCAEQSTCQFYCKELNRNNALFTAYLAWCESQKMCNRLRLADILVRPMQRLTKYSLLLTAIRKHITDENDADIMDSMSHSVENFVCSVNSHLTTRQENERLKGIMARIESYDVVDSNNEQLDKLTKQYCTMFDLCSPMKGCTGAQGRHLFMEGDLKFKDSIGKVDVHCFLLTDILLICKTIAKKSQGTLKVIRQPYITDRLVVRQKDNILYCVYLNEFQMAVTAFTLQCSEAKSWHDAITKAKHIYSRIRQGTNWDAYNIRYSNINQPTVNSTDTLGIKKSPLNSSIGSRVSSLNNSHSGSVELDSRNISVDFEKTNSLSSDEGSYISSNHTMPTKPKTLSTSPHKLKATSSNQLVVQPLTNLGQSLPNLNLHPSQASNLYHTYSNNTLLVPGTGSSHSGNLLLSPCHRGISYPPPSPTRATLRRGFAFSSIKNPPLVKTRNISSQNIINWHPTTPVTPSTSPQPQQQANAVQFATTSLQTSSNESDV